MGKRSREIAKRRVAALDKVEPQQLQTESQPAATRNVPYENLLATGRTVRYHTRLGNAEGEYWIEVQLAGEQGADFDAAKQNRSFYVAFATKQAARRTGDSLVFKLRKMHKQGRINTDVRYNLIIKAFASAVEAEIKQSNERLLEEATEKVRTATSPHIGAIKPRSLLAIIKEKLHLQRKEEEQASATTESDSE